MLTDDRYSRKVREYFVRYDGDEIRVIFQPCSSSEIDTNIIGRSSLWCPNSLLRMFLFADMWSDFVRTLRGVKDVNKTSVSLICNVQLIGRKHVEQWEPKWVSFQVYQ